MAILTQTSCLDSQRKAQSNTIINKLKKKRDFKVLNTKWTENKALKRLNKFNATIVRTSFTKKDEEEPKAAFCTGE